MAKLKCSLNCGAYESIYIPAESLITFQPFIPCNVRTAFIWPGHNCGAATLREMNEDRNRDCRVNNKGILLPSSAPIWASFSLATKDSEISFSWIAAHFIRRRKKKTLARKPQRLSIRQRLIQVLQRFSQLCAFLLADHGRNGKSSLRSIASAPEHGERERQSKGA